MNGNGMVGTKLATIVSKTLIFFCSFPLVEKKRKIGKNEVCFFSQDSEPCLNGAVKQELMKYFHTVVYINFNPHQFLISVPMGL